MHIVTRRMNKFRFEGDQQEVKMEVSIEEAEAVLRGLDATGECGELREALRAAVEDTLISTVTFMRKERDDASG